MPRSIIYWRQPDEIAGTPAPLDDGSEWWVTSFACGALLAVAAAALPIPAVAAQQDDLSAVAGQPDEDFWNNLVAPVQASFYQQLPLGDPEEIPAGALRGQPDEEFSWQQLTGPPFPSQPAFYRALLLGQDDADFVSAAFQPDEEFWPSPPAAQPTFRQQSGDPDEIPAGALRGQPDEDYWLNTVKPILASLYQRLPLGDPEEIPAASLRGQPDEDFWNNLVAPVAVSFYQALPFRDPEEIPAGSLHGQPDEDYWASPQPQAAATPRQPFTADDDLPVAVALPFDEEPWQNQVAPVQVAFGRLLLPDPEEIPAGSLVVLVGPPDEDYWVNQIAPVQATLYQCLPIGDPEEVPAGVLRGQPDEDYWKSPEPQAPSLARPAFAADDDLPLAATFASEEEFWNLSKPAPVQASVYRGLPLGDPEEIPAASLRGQPDEDFQLLGPAPVVLLLYQRLPYLPDPEEVPAGALRGQPDEDFYRPPPPTQVQFYQQLPLGDPEELPARTLHGQPDEDFWPIPPPTMAALYQQLPYGPDDQLVPSAQASQVSFYFLMLLQEDRVVSLAQNVRSVALPQDDRTVALPQDSRIANLVQDLRTPLLLTRS